MRERERERERGTAICHCVKQVIKVAVLSNCAKQAGHESGCPVKLCEAGHDYSNLTLREASGMRVALQL